MRRPAYSRRILRDEAQTPDVSSLVTLLVVVATGGVRRMTQIMDLLNQAPDIPEEIQLLRERAGECSGERSRPAAESWDRQLARNGVSGESTIETSRCEFARSS